MDHKLWLVGLDVAMGGWCHERSVGFGHDAVVWNQRCRSGHFGGILERHHAGEGNPSPKVQHVSSLVGRSGEAVEDELVGGKPGIGQSWDQISGGLAAVDHDGLGQTAPSPTRNELKLSLK